MSLLSEQDLQFTPLHSQIKAETADHINQALTQIKDIFDQVIPAHDSYQHPEKMITSAPEVLELLDAQLQRNKDLFPALPYQKDEESGEERYRIKTRGSKSAEAETALEILKVPEGYGVRLFRREQLQPHSKEKALVAYQLTCDHKGTKTAFNGEYLIEAGFTDAQTYQFDPENGTQVNRNYFARLRSMFSKEK